MGVTINLVKPATNFGIVYGGERYFRDKSSSKAMTRAGVSASSLVLTDVGMDLIPSVNNSVAKITGNEYSHDVSAALLTTGYCWYMNKKGSVPKNFLVSLGYNVATSMVTPGISKMVPAEARSIKL